MTSRATQELAPAHFHESLVSGKPQGYIWCHIHERGNDFLALQFIVCLIRLVVRMLLFCPTCSNVLTVEEGSGPSLYRFACQTCPYVYNITKKVRIHVGILHIF